MTKTAPDERRARALAHACILALALAAVFACADAVAHAALAQIGPGPGRNPFDMGMREGGGPPTTGLTAWILAQQMQFERTLSGAVRAIATDASALWTLMGLSFAYGVFHAAGPGHGKAVVASYMFANERSLKRGLAISAMAALLQAVVAIAIVGVLAVVLNATSARMKEAANLVELASYGGVALLGAWLVWRKGRALLAALGSRAHTRQSHAHAANDDRPHHAGRAHADHHHDTAHAHEPAKPEALKAHAHGAHVHDEHCGHFHAPAPETLGEGFTWRGAVATVFAAGARPCSGAILVLVFALAQGIFFAGVAAALAMSVGTAITTGALAAMAVGAKGLAVRFLGEGSRGGVVGVRALEFAAALLVLLMGASLLLGALAGA
ncbi:MAG: Nickel/cobalt efflux system [Hyphomicrobiales bacterium]|nr:Nickel/cobalt efflux system [Hyphomicrobiales bacterium]MDB5593112.1 Nickel/cobalt efflux system [Hyphomicrobiales bacterium]